MMRGFILGVFMKKIRNGLLLLLGLVFMTSCTGKENLEAHKKTFYGTFDTKILYLSYTESEDRFDEEFDFVEEEFNKLHKLYDRYNAYEGVNNLKTINDMAGKEAVKVDDDLFDVIKFSLDNFDKTDGKVNIAMGSVLRLWHDVRSQNEGVEEKDMILPKEEELLEAAKHMDIKKVVLDEKEKTVYLEDEKMSLDLGAVAKGYAAELVAQRLEEKGVKHASINAGGNVRTIGNPGDGRKNWGIAIEHPLMGEADDFLDVLFIGQTSVVTSGDYQRYFTKDGIKYHHIVDPVSLRPEIIYSSVSIVTKDSGLADYLSTALFLSSKEEAEKILENYKEEDVEVLWYSHEEGESSTPGLEKHMRSKGATSK